MGLDSMRPLDAGYGINMCADHCKCPKEYDPVCGQDMTFFSPCHAGCTSKELIDGSYFVSEIICQSVAVGLSVYLPMYMHV